MNEEQNSIHTSEPNFQEIKTVASENISSIVKDFQDFELAIQTENMPDIYRIYKGRLHDQLKATANQNHEIDELMMRKIHDNFLKKFPFMQLAKQLSPTMNYYQLSSYYHERATFAVDASIPEIFIVPEVEDEWMGQINQTTNTLKKIEERMDTLEAMTLTAQQELDEITAHWRRNKQLLATKKEASQGFFNRTKADQETEKLEKVVQELGDKKEKLERFIEDKQSIANERQELMNTYQFSRLKQAIITKELRLITQYFHSYEEMKREIDLFLKDYLTKKEGEPR